MTLRFIFVRLNVLRYVYNRFFLLTIAEQFMLAKVAFQTVNSIKNNINSLNLFYAFSYLFFVLSLVDV